MTTQETPNIPELLGFNGLVVNWLNVKYRPTFLSQFINDLTFSSGGVQVNSDWDAVAGPALILNKPTIPTLTSELTNDSGFITLGDIPPIPTLTSELTNDSGFITSAAIPTVVSAFTNDANYITLADVPAQVNTDWNSVAGVSQLLNKPTLATIATSGLYSDLTGQPTNVSAFTNDVPYLTSGSISSQFLLLDQTTPQHIINGSPLFDVGLVVPKTTGTGIKVDTSSPTFGYRDLLGQIFPRQIGGTAPTAVLVKGTGTRVRLFAYGAGDTIDCVVLHIPHDYVVGTDVFIHLHWEHAGTAISGNLIMNWYMTYCKGYNQPGNIFGAEINVTQTIATPNIATFPQYGHFIQEFQATNAGGDATHLNRALLQPDGILNISGIASTIPTITGAPAGSANEPFLIMVDLHYQSTSMGTKDKNFPFYT